MWMLPGMSSHIWIYHMLGPTMVAFTNALPRTQWAVLSMQPGWMYTVSSLVFVIVLWELWNNARIYRMTFRIVHRCVKECMQCCRHCWIYAWAIKCEIDQMNVPWINLLHSYIIIICTKSFLRTDRVTMTTIRHDSRRNEIKRCRDDCEITTVISVALAVENVRCI